jgi:hypothetical protein
VYLNPAGEGDKLNPNKPELKIYGIARAAQALAPRVALSFLSKSMAYLKCSTSYGINHV